MTKELKSKVFIPENYKSNLSLIETEIAIKKVKDFFEFLREKSAQILDLSSFLWYSVDGAASNGRQLALFAGAASFAPLFYERGAAQWLLIPISFSLEFWLLVLSACLSR